MSNSFFQLETTLPVNIVLALALILLLAFGWLEWKRNVRFLVLRLVAVLVTIVSFTAFLLRPAFLTDSVSGDVILLTPRYAKSVVDSLYRVHPHVKIITAPGAAPYADAERLTNDNEVLDLKDNIRFVAGDGLPEYFLPSAAKFLKGGLPDGIIQLNIPQRIVVNRTASVTGLWNGVAATLALNGPGGKEDSTRVESNQPFALKFKSRQAGKYIYTISIRTEEKSWEEKLPVEVQEPQPVRMLIWQQYPSAETRFLKNFLVEQGHRVVVRTQISKTNFRLEYGNHAQVPVSRITPDLLNNFDLLVLANEASPAANEASIIEQAVQEGLGVLWLPAETEFTKPPFGFTFNKIEPDTAHVTYEGVVTVFPSWPFAGKDKVVPVVANAKRALMGYKSKGAGKTGYSLLAESYPLITNGRPEAYGAMWTRILESVARTHVKTTVIRLQAEFPVYNEEPLELKVISALEAPMILADSIHVALREHPVIDQYWTGTTWLTETGWHQVLSPADSVALNFYSFDAGAWQALRVAKLHQLNKMRLTGSPDIDAGTVRIAYRAIEPIWFFLLFVLAAGFLWLAPKL
ncbi:MAG: hypothetical protein KIT62_05340 [Cyclobacteriaceae bacterium]|nr:hypothetical protein [Cyclobacteriaceae bacterium]